MSDESKRVLKMLAAGKITVEEAERLLGALAAAPEPPAAPAPKGAVQSGRPQYLRVVVDETAGEKAKVNIRVPLRLLRSGMKLKGLLPDQARQKLDAKLGEKGIHLDLDGLDQAGVDDFIAALTEMAVEIDSDDAKVRVFCE